MKLIRGQEAFFIKGMVAKEVRKEKMEYLRMDWAGSLWEWIGNLVVNMDM